MVTYIGVEEGKIFSSVLHGFIELAFYYNHNGRVVIISDSLTKLDYSNFIRMTNFEVEDKLSLKKYQDCTFLSITDFGELNKILYDMYEEGCKPDACFIHFSKDFIKKKDRILSNYYNKLYHSFMGNFPDINFIITVDNTYLNDCLRMP